MLYFSQWVTKAEPSHQVSGFTCDKGRPCRIKGGTPVVKKTSQQSCY